MINLYSHDHDVDTEEHRAILERRIAAIRATSRIPMTIGELGTWLESARSNELASVRWRDGEAMVEGSLVPGTVIENRGVKKRPSNSISQN
ncbi:MAG: hypothetical protein GWP75_08995, partial [Planctomycetia bacterium]|nr:hypothetical protein [Planctomycetia bacterium]